MYVTDMRAADIAAAVAAISAVVPGRAHSLCLVALHRKGACEKVATLAVFNSLLPEASSVPDFAVDDGVRNSSVKSQSLLQQS